jgi:surface antigen
MRLPRKALGLAVTALAFILAFSAAEPAAATTSVLCSSWRWSCDGKLGYNPRHSYWGQYTGHNCTNYVAFRMIRDGWSKNLGPFNGNARVWDDYFKSRGYKVDGHPAVGAIAQWNGYENGQRSGSGHVAYVDVVGSNYIIIDEDGWNSIQRRRKIFRGDRNWPGRFIHLDRKVAKFSAKKSSTK